MHNVLTSLVYHALGLLHKTGSLLHCKKQEEAMKYTLCHAIFGICATIFVGVAVAENTSEATSTTATRAAITADRVAFHDCLTHVDMIEGSFDNLLLTRESVYATSMHHEAERLARRIEQIHAIRAAETARLVRRLQKITNQVTEATNGTCYPFDTWHNEQVNSELTHCLRLLLCASRMLARARS